MRKFWGPFFIAVIILVATFFITSVSMASYHDHTIVDEWRSWLPAQEEVVEDNNVLDEEATTGEPELDLVA